jgi:hypothetical protein
MSTCNFTQTINEDECIGDSLDTINSNFNSLDNQLCDLKNTVNLFNVTDSNTIDLNFNTTTRTLCAEVNPNIFQKINFDASSLQDVTNKSQVEFLNIPNWTKRITFICNKVSATNNGYISLQIGTQTGGFEDAGYEVIVAINIDPSITSSGILSGYLINQQDMSPGYTLTGTITLTNLIGTNTWVANGMLGTATTGNIVIAAGTKTLSSTLDRIRIIADTAVGTLSGGTVNIICEG